jgi:mRNA interferase HigB
MRVISRKRLREFWERPGCGDARNPLLVWFKEVEMAQWLTPVGIKASYRHATVLKAGRVVFNIAGNKYRIVAKINYAYQVLYIRFVGTHEEYDRIDANTI